MNDLSLIPFDDLMKEIDERCIVFVAAYELPKEKDSEMKFYYGKGKWFKAVQLSSILNNDILNNYNGELRTLQRLHNED